MRLVLLTVPFVLFAPSVQADDGDLQRALIEVSCPTAKVTRLKPIGRSKVYQADCFGRRIKIVCMDGRCFTDDVSHSREDPE